MVKSEQEIQKVVKAMGFLYLKSSVAAFCETPTRDAVKEVKAEFALLPGQSNNAESLIKCSINTGGNKDIYIPESGYITETLKQFVLAVRAVFTSIHEFKKSLEVTVTQLPDEADMDWVDSVLKSYGVAKVKQYMAVVPLPGYQWGTLGDLTYGTAALDNMQLYIKANYFIPRVEGLESIASREEDRATLKPGLSFREL